MTEDEAWGFRLNDKIKRTVDWSESKCGEINPQGRYTGLVGDPSRQREHDRGQVEGYG